MGFTFLADSLIVQKLTCTDVNKRNPALPIEHRFHSILDYVMTIRLYSMDRRGKIVEKH